MKKNWKKVVMVILLTLALVMMLIPTLFAAENSAPVEIGSTGILPTNPFYFVVGWSRGLRLALTFNALSKTRYEMNIADEKLTEFQAIEKIDPANNTAILTALGNYTDGLLSLQNRVGSLKDVPNSPEVDLIFRNLNAELMRHESILINLEASHTDISSNFNETIALIGKIMAEIPAKLLKNF